MQSGSAFWPYPWADCELMFAAREHRHNGGYCKGEGTQYSYEVDCTDMDRNRYLGYFDSMMLRNQNGKEIDAITDFASAEGFGAWMGYFWKGLLKLGSFGATWGDNVVRLPCSLLSTAWFSSFVLLSFSYPSTGEVWPTAPASRLDPVQPQTRTDGCGNGWLRRLRRRVHAASTAAPRADQHAGGAGRRTSANEHVVAC